MLQLGSNIICFNREFNDAALEFFMAEMRKAEESGANEVTILINSPGGSLSILKTMLDAIYLTEMKVITVASGMVASCGILLLMAGDERYAFKDADLMSHPFSTVTRGNYRKLTSSRVFEDRTHKFMVDHYKLHTGLQKEVIEGLLLEDQDVYLTAKQAKDLNIIDDIIIPKIKPIGHAEKLKSRIKRHKEAVRTAENFLTTMNKMNAQKQEEEESL